MNGGLCTDSCLVDYILVCVVLLQEVQNEFHTDIWGFQGDKNVDCNLGGIVTPCRLVGGYQRFTVSFCPAGKLLQLTYRL